MFKICQYPNNYNYLIKTLREKHTEPILLTLKYCIFKKQVYISINNLIYTLIYQCNAKNIHIIDVMKQQRFMSNILSLHDVFDGQIDFIYYY